ncbi:MAG TPA: glycosyltransferase family 2 protein [Lacunisphaera sp.]|nr:glycosyltransferase family 2 protein [Lacunisphaera sp.]
MVLSIIIVNWNSQKFVRQCLASLAKYRPPVEFEAIVVDGASFDGCDAMLAREFPWVRYVQSPTNVGFGRANNLGARHATGRYLLLLNPDTEFIEDMISTMLGCMERLPQAGAVGCRLLNANHTLQTTSTQSYPTVLNQLLDSEFLRHLFPRSSLWGMQPLYAEGGQPVEAEAISGACVLLHRERFEAVGGFTDSYFMYGEDLDLSYKLNRAGYTNYHIPSARLVHFGGGSSKQAASNFSTVMMRESVHRFMRSNRGAFSALAYRVTTGASALARLVLIFPLMLFGDRIVRHGTGSLRKWKAVFKWSIGRPAQAAARSSSPANPPVQANTV